MAKKYYINFLSFVVIVSLVNMVLYHYPLLKYALHHIEFIGASSLFTLLTIVVAQFCVTVLLLSAIGIVSLRLAKWFTMLFLITNSIAFYFVHTYSTILTKAMMGNVFNTNPDEAGELFSLMIVVYLLLLGILPALLIQRFNIHKTSIIKRVGIFAGTLVFVLVWGFANSSSWLWFDKHSKNVGGLSMPLSYIINSISYKIDSTPKKAQALLDPLTFNNPSSPQTVVLIIGESARSDRFALYGYPKETTPLLAKHDIVTLPDPISCSTYTTASIACMLSHKGSKVRLTDNDEPLPSYLKRFGVSVLWRSKNWGEPPIQTDLYQRSDTLKQLCTNNCDGGEFDEVMLYGLNKTIADLNGSKKFIVLHQIGSHGPTYTKRYPPSFEHFKPVCNSVQLQECTQEALDNAYDNSIRYTDYFLSTLIDKLGKLQGEVVMIYISDHGESLGESGFYLHGAPNLIAPKFQRAVPFIVWMNDEFKRAKNLTNRSIVKESSYTQDYIFHSILGAFDANSTIYNERFDLFR